MPVGVEIVVSISCSSALLPAESKCFLSLRVPVDRKYKFNGVNKCRCRMLVIMKKKKRAVIYNLAFGTSTKKGYWIFK